MRILQMGRAKMLIGGKKGTDYAAVALLLVHFILTVGSIATISEEKNDYDFANTIIDDKKEVKEAFI